MKKKMYSILLLTGVFAMACTMLYSCTKRTFDRENDCHEHDQLYCGKDIEGCCGEGYPWSDGHGTCYNSLSYCRSSGWNCTGCY
jgi:hypothetical protein